ncbi:uncharacterized protein LOC114934364 [Nylanderia fulva]|uniref:uncharacterized protein LOC114934364 n=1 Tax=Nylanderia fulva TaxID=613905 RepID=UPI0010FB2FFE|nr:uncharacterized protein LOC114934364 [Nylanderia fulva]XP_029162884.1 uncharacterized protein LOC114934364 [Nylanderia fulva]
MPKDIRFLSKRRKNQLINCQYNLHKNLNLLQLVESNKACNNIKEATLTREECNNNISCRDNILSNDSNEFHEFEIEHDTNNKKECNIELKDNTPTTNISYCNNENNLWKDLQMLIINCNIPHSCANELLRILITHGHVELPYDVRCLLRTPRNTFMHIKSMGNGRYFHFGILSSLERSIQMYSTFIKTNEITLNINTDGLPLCKSSGSQFWPIMGSIEGIDIYTSPFIIGVYHGMCKPNDANEFLTDFINDFISLSQNGITVLNNKYTVAIGAILCDAPARAFITRTKGHTGYFSCPKCIQEGDFVHNRVVFPQTHNTLRTDDAFKNRAQPEHHTGDSILEKLHIGMISQIPLDYMHLVCLGVTKRLLQIWQRGNKHFRLSKECVNLISQHLMVIQPYIPVEFARKPRDLRDIDRWKATELRQFLLYTGIVVMKSTISSIYYNHFLCLSVAIRILIDPQLCVTFNDYANSLLLHFVSNYGNIYGDQYLSYNVHNLIHLANDVNMFGSLDNFSCFKYENNMQKIKKKLRSGKPLEELINRTSEELQLPIQPCHKKNILLLFTHQKTIFFIYNSKLLKLLLTKLIIVLYCMICL